MTSVVAEVANGTDPLRALQIIVRTVSDPKSSLSKNPMNHYDARWMATWAQGPPGIAASGE